MDMNSLVETIVDIPLAQLHDSPFQYRRTYNQAKLQELADTMKPPLGRVLQPVVVRVPPKPMRPLFDGVDTFNDYELVFGHRRKRAAELAGLATLPAIVRVMSDEEVERAQIIENLAREDVHAIEEAEGFQKLMQDHGIGAEQLVEQTGKSRSYIYGRLKLLQAVPTVRDACLRGEIGSEVALLIARLRHTKLQERALKAIEAKYMKLDDGGKKSYREIKRLLAEMFTLDLKSAIFDPEDAALVASAGVCSACDKLSANAPEFTDLTEKRPDYYPGHFEAGNPRLCTDPVCWDGKHKAHLVREAERMRADGKVVVDGNKARAALSADGKTVKGAYLSLADVKTALKGSGKKSSDLPIVNIQDQRTGKTVQAVAAAELKTIGVAKPEAQKPQRSYYQMTPEEREKQQEEQASNALRHDRLMRTCVAKLREAPRSSLDLNTLTVWALEQLNYWCADGKWIAKRWGFDSLTELANAVPSLSADEKGVLLMAVVMASNEDRWLNGAHTNVPKSVETIAAAAGIPIELAMSTPMPDEVVEAASTPSPAARADDGEDDEAEEIEYPFPTAARAPTGASAKGKVSYRNALTGETWSGRGLMPKWLKVAIADGKTLADFEVASTLSPAARAAGGADGSAGAAADQVQSQAGFAGKDDEGAGSAVAGTASAEDLEGIEA